MELLTKSYILDLEEETGLRRNDLRRQFNQQLLDRQHPLKGGKDKKHRQFVVCIDLPPSKQEEDYLKDSENSDYPDTYYERYFELTKILDKILKDGKEFVSNHCHHGFFENSSPKCEIDDDEATAYEDEDCIDWLRRLDALEKLDKTHVEKIKACAVDFKNRGELKKKLERRKSQRSKGKEEDKENESEGKEEDKENELWTKECKELYGTILNRINKKEERKEETLKTVGISFKEYQDTKFHIYLRPLNFIGRLVHIRNFFGSKFLHTGEYTIDRGGEKTKWKKYGNGYLFKELLHEFIDQYKLDILIEYRETSAKVTLYVPDNQNPDQACDIEVIRGPYSNF